MDRWLSVRKGYEGIHLSYAHSFSNNLCAYNTRVRYEPELEIRVDLNPNLRGRSKETGTYLDAFELADGSMRELRLYQTEDERLFKTLDGILQRMGGSPDTWRLTLELKGDWSFRVRAEVKRSHQLVSLFLHVVEPLQAPGQ